MARVGKLFMQGLHAKTMPGFDDTLGFVPIFCALVVCLLHVLDQP